MVLRVKFHLNLFSHFREEDFWRFKKTKQYGYRITWPMMSSKNFVDHFIPRWPSKIFILIGLTFFIGAVSDTEVQRVSVFPTWLPHHVTYDIIIETFYMSCHTYGENFILIRQAVAEKNTKVLFGQTNKQTNKRTQIQYPLLRRGEQYGSEIIWMRQRIKLNKQCHYTMQKCGV